MPLLRQNQLRQPGTEQAPWKETKVSDWRDRAECLGAGAHIFFPDIEKGERGDHVWEQARSICSVCPVTRECLSYALPFEEVTGRRDGMFGGLTPKERDQLVWKRMTSPGKR